MLKRFGLIAAGLLVMGSAQAQHTVDGKIIDLFYVGQSDLEQTTAAGASSTADASGFGISTQFRIYSDFYLNGEYQGVNVKDSDQELNQLRLGVGYMLPTDKSLKFYVNAQFMNVESGIPGNSSNNSGYVGHGGILYNATSMFKFFAEYGIVSLSQSDGAEFKVGTRAKLSDDFSIFVDYRDTTLDADDNSELNISDIRAGFGFIF